MRLAALVLLAACTGAGTPDAGPSDADPSDTGPCGRTPELTWANFGQSWMAKHCVGCHSSLLREDQRNDAPVGVDLDTWEDAVMWGPRILGRSAGADADMPPGGGPSEDERRMLTEWLTCAVLPAGSVE